MDTIFNNTSGSPTLFRRGMKANRGRVEMPPLPSEATTSYRCLIRYVLASSDLPGWRTAGKCRKRMRRNFPEKPYNQKPKVETVNSVEKRKFGDELSAKLLKMQRREMKVIDAVYNIHRYVSYLLAYLVGILHSRIWNKFVYKKIISQCDKTSAAPAGLGSSSRIATFIEGYAHASSGPRLLFTVPVSNMSDRAQALNAIGRVEAKLGAITVSSDLYKRRL